MFIIYVDTTDIPVSSLDEIKAALQHRREMGFKGISLMVEFPIEDSDDKDASLSVNKASVRNPIEREVAAESGASKANERRSSVFSFDTSVGSTNFEADKPKAPAPSSCAVTSVAGEATVKPDLKSDLPLQTCSEIPLSEVDRGVFEVGPFTSPLSNTPTVQVIGKNLNVVTAEEPGSSSRFGGVGVVGGDVGGDGVGGGDNNGNVKGRSISGVDAGGGDSAAALHDVDSPSHDETPTRRPELALNVPPRPASPASPASTASPTSPASPCPRPEAELASLREVEHTLRQQLWSKEQALAGIYF